MCLRVCVCVVLPAAEYLLSSRYLAAQATSLAVFKQLRP
jgi:hypothetical protein